MELCWAQLKEFNTQTSNRGRELKIRTVADKIHIYKQLKTKENTDFAQFCVTMSNDMKLKGKKIRKQTKMLSLRHITFQKSYERSSM